MAGRCRPFVAGVVLSYSDWAATRQQTVVEPAGRLKIQVALRFAIALGISGVNNVYGLLRQSVDRRIATIVDHSLDDSLKPHQIHWDVGSNCEIVTSKNFCG